MTTPAPSPSVEVRPAQPADHELLTALWMLFQHELSAFTGVYPDARGHYRSERLEAAIGDPHWIPYLIFVDTHPAGLVVVRGIDQVPHVLTAFFLVNPARGRGIGAAAAQHVLRRHPGEWEIAFQDTNVRAAGFWRRLAQTVADEDWQEEQRPVPRRPDLPPDNWISFRLI